MRTTGTRPDGSARGDEEGLDGHARGEAPSILAPPARSRRYIFASGGDEPLSRRPVDAALLALGLIGLVVASLVADAPPADEQDAVDAASSLFGWFDAAWHVLYAATFFFALVILVAAVVERRRTLVLQLACALVLVTVVAVLLGWIVEGHRPELWDYLRGAANPSFPPWRLALVSVVVAVARADLTRPLRRLGIALVLLAGAAGLVLGAATPSGILCALSLGLAAAAAVHLLLGSPAGFPDRSRVLAGLSDLSVGVTILQAAPRQVGGVARYRARDITGRPLEVKVYGRDARDTQFLAKSARLLAYRDPGPLLASSLLEQVEHEAVVTMLAAQAGVTVPEVEAVGRVTTGDALIVLAGRPSTRLTELDPDAVTDAMLAEIWQARSRLASHGIAHGRAADAVRVVDGQVVFVDFSSGRLNATTTQLGSDMAELLVLTAVVVGEERALRAAVADVGQTALARVIPYVQRSALSSSLRDAVRERDYDLEQLRRRAADATGTELPAMAELRRVTWGGLALMALVLVAAYTLISMLADIGFDTIIDELSNAIWQWVLVALILAQCTLVSQATSLHGAVPTPLPLWPSVALQSAIKFVNLTVPTAAGRIAINVRFLQRLGVPTAAAVTTGALDGLAGTVVEIILVIVIIIFGHLDIDVSSANVPSGIVWIIAGVIVGAVVVVLCVALIPALRAKVLPPIKVALHNLRLIVSSPRQLTLLFGGNLASEILFALVLGASLKAYGGSLPLTDLLFINMAVTVFAGIMPIPGGIGVAEAGLTAGLVAFGVPEPVAFATAITHRLATFYLPPIWGYFSLRWLRSRGFV